jgi:arylsulfatase A-like enzyme
MARPNLLIVMTDQHRADGVRCMWPGWRETSTPLMTPNLDALAAQGVAFSNAYCNHPICMPSRATLVTGRTPRGHGSRMNGTTLSPRIPTVMDAFHAAGFRTYSAGKIHLSSWNPPRGIDLARARPEDHPECIATWEGGLLKSLPLPYHGFHETDYVAGHGPWMWGDYRNWLATTHPEIDREFQWEKGKRPPGAPNSCFRLEMPPEIHYNSWIADRTIGFLERASADGAPFMAWASFPDPHGPFAAPEPFYSRYDRGSMPPPVRRPGEAGGMPPHLRKEAEKPGTTDAELAEITAVTFGMVSFVDSQIGRILSALDRLGLSGNTVVAFIADHGEMLGDHWLLGKGFYSYRGIIQTPHIWRFPGRFPGGRVVDGIVSHLDFAPTVLEVAGLSIPDEPAVPGNPDTFRADRTLPGRSLLPVLEGKAGSVRDGALVEHDSDSWNGLRLRTIVTERGQLAMYMGLGGEVAFGELYDHVNDPGQLHNLWDDPGYGGLRSDLKSRLLEEIVATDSLFPSRETDF